MNLKRRKKGGKRRAKKDPVKEARDRLIDQREDEDQDEDHDEGMELDEGVDLYTAEDDGGHEKKVSSPHPVDDDDDPDDPLKTTPLTRYNAMLAIVKNTLFM